MLLSLFQINDRNESLNQTKERDTHQYFYPFPKKPATHFGEISVSKMPAFDWK